MLKRNALLFASLKKLIAVEFGIPVACVRYQYTLFPVTDEFCIFSD
jgi:hypothetical protein